MKTTHVFVGVMILVFGMCGIAFAEETFDSPSSSSSGSGYSSYTIVNNSSYTIQVTGAGAPRDNTVPSGGSITMNTNPPSRLVSLMA
jgi:hypothetical protein